MKFRREYLDTTVALSPLAEGRELKFVQNGNLQNAQVGRPSRRGVN